MNIITNSAGKQFMIGGRRPPIVTCPRLSLKNYMFKALPAPPALITDYTKAPAAFLAEILGNDTLGDCTDAGAFHIAGTLLANAGYPIPFTRDDVIKLYSATAGYVVGDPSTDQGGDEQTVLNYWMQHGLTPGAADPHKCEGWCHIDASNPDECRTAIWLFENLYFGMGLPDAYISPMPEVSGFTWGIAGAANPNNGHAFPALTYNNEGPVIDTWGLLGTITWEAVAAYAIQAAGGELYTILSSDSISKAAAKAPSGFDFTQLTADLQAIRS
jgi:hypothetical protein